MNFNQSKLLLNVLEQIETNLQDNLNSDVQDYAFDEAQECLDGLRHIGNILENYDDVIARDDMNWVIGELFKDDVEGIEFINAINDDFEICTDSEVRGLIGELKSM